MPIWGCGSPAHCCQPAVAGGFIYVDLRSECNTHLAPQALFSATATSFPLSKHTRGGDTAPAFSGQRVYLQFTWEVTLPPSPVEFSSHCHFYKLSRSWLPPLLPSLVGLFIYSSIKDCPFPPSALRVLHPLCYVSFLLLLLIIQFFFFFPGWGLVCPGGYADLAQDCLWEFHVPLRSPCGLHLPKRLVAVWEPSWFLHLTWSGDALHRLEVWRSQNFASSQWFFL
jgi:hypothetical protein